VEEKTISGLRFISRMKAVIGLQKTKVTTGLGKNVIECFYSNLQSAVLASLHTSDECKRNS
jgi:hypothetical protein